MVQVNYVQWPGEPNTFSRMEPVGIKTCSCSVPSYKVQNIHRFAAEHQITSITHSTNISRNDLEIGLSKFYQTHPLVTSSVGSATWPSQAPNPKQQSPRHVLSTGSKVVSLGWKSRLHSLYHTSSEILNFKSQHLQPRNQAKGSRMSMNTHLSSLHVFVHGSVMESWSISKNGGPRKILQKFAEMVILCS